MPVASIDKFGFHIKTEEFALNETEIITAFEISVNMVHRSELTAKDSPVLIPLISNLLC